MVVYPIPSPHTLYSVWGNAALQHLYSHSRGDGKPYLVANRVFHQSATSPV